MRAIGRFVLDALGAVAIVYLLAFVTGDPPSEVAGWFALGAVIVLNASTGATDE